MVYGLASSASFANFTESYTMLDRVRIFGSSEQHPFHFSVSGTQQPNQNFSAIMASTLLYSITEMD